MFGAIAGGIASALAGGAMSKLFGGRSEERFSRNAETELVCRLLLEKKKVRNSGTMRLMMMATMTSRSGTETAISQLRPTSFFFSLFGHPLDLHSFPTRRSSDLLSPAT